MAEPASSDSSGVSLPGAVAIGIGGMVGGGIFATLGVAAEQAGGATPLAFLLGGIVAALTATSYAKLSVRYRSSGGTVTFIDEIFGVELLSGTVNVLLWVGYIATTALYSAAFANYAAALIVGGGGASGVLVRALVLVGVLVPWVINLARASLIARTESTVVAIKVAILVAVVVAGVPSIEPDRLGTSQWSSPMAIIAAGMLVFVAYEGFELISNASTDLQDPQRNLPRAFAWSVGIVVVLYLAIAAVVVGSLDPERIVAAADYALAEAADSSLGGVGFVLVGISAVLATFSAINATLYGAARLSFTLATEGELPAGFRERPWSQPVGLHVTAAGGAAIAVALPVGSISSVSSSIFLIVFATVNVAAFRAGADAQVIRPLAAAGAVLCATSRVVLTVVNVRDDPISLLVLGVLVAAGLVTEHSVLGPARRAARLPS